MHISVGRQSVARQRRCWRWLVVLTGLFLDLGLQLVVPQQARAQNDQSPNSNFNVSAIEIEVPDDDNKRLDETLLTTNTYFNRARCRCNTRLKITLRVDQDLSDSTNQYFVVAGTNCVDNNKLVGCQQLDSGSVNEVTEDIEIDSSTVNTVMEGDCEGDSELQIQTYLGEAQSLSAVGVSLQYSTDGKPPTQPERVGDPEPGEGRVTLNFKKGSEEPNVRYQILCERTDNRQPWKQGGGKNAVFVSEYTECGGGTTAVAEPDAGAGVDAAVADGGQTADGTLAERLLKDPDYICSEGFSGTETEVAGLQDEVEYNFYVVAIDLAGNPSAVVFLGSGTPSPAEDLWERYKRSGGQAEGGYCQLGPSPAPAAAPLLWVALALLRRRRRGGRR